MLIRRRQPPIYLFILWSTARAQQTRILDDIGVRFTILDVVEVTWTPDATFARNLSRMYGDALPPHSDKELHCGTGPFLAVVVEDDRPRFAIRHTGHGRKVLNSSVFDARRDYREWTGGGHRVHASDSVIETERNLVLLFGARTEAFRGRRPACEGMRVHAADPVGTHGWTSVEQLLVALEPYGARASSRPAEDRLSVVASDVWWAEQIAGGRELRQRVRELHVARRRLELDIRQAPSGPMRTLRGLAHRVCSW